MLSSMALLSCSWLMSIESDMNILVNSFISRGLVNVDTLFFEAFELTCELSADLHADYGAFVVHIVECELYAFDYSLFVGFVLTFGSIALVVAKHIAAVYVSEVARN